jgi:tetratricopeptide (TPR) repeat protein
MDVTSKQGAQQDDMIQRYEVMQEMGDCYVNVGDFDKARECYEKAAVLSPDEAGPYVGLGVVDLQSGLINDADVAFRVATRLDRRCSKAYAGLAMVAQQKKDYKRAFDVYLKCLEIDSDNLTALLGLFQVSSMMGSFGKVIYYLENYLASNVGDSSVMFTLGALYVRDGRLDEARELLREVLRLTPENKDAADLLEEVEHDLVGIESGKV